MESLWSIYWDPHCEIGFSTMKSALEWGQGTGVQHSKLETILGCTVWHAHSYQGEENQAALSLSGILSGLPSRWLWSVLAHLAKFSQHYRRPLHMSMSLWVSKNNNERVTTKKHLADESILVHRFGLFLSFPSFWRLQKQENLSLPS